MKSIFLFCMVMLNCQFVFAIGDKVLLDTKDTISNYEMFKIEGLYSPSLDSYMTTPTIFTLEESLKVKYGIENITCVKLETKGFNKRFVCRGPINATPLSEEDQNSILFHKNDMFNKEEKSVYLTLRIDEAQQIYNSLLKKNPELLKTPELLKQVFDNNTQSLIKQRAQTLCSAAGMGKLISYSVKNIVNNASFSLSRKINYGITYDKDGSMNFQELPSSRKGVSAVITLFHAIRCHK